MSRNLRMRRMIVFILVLTCLLAFPAVTFAAGLSVTADSTEVKIGDTVTLTVIVSGEHIAVADGSFTYDPALLTFIGSNGGASDGYIDLVSAQKGGSSSLTAIIKFAASGEGAAEVRVSIDSVLDYDGQALEGAEAGVSITVTSTPGATDAGPGETPIDFSMTGVAAQNVLGAAEQMYIWRSLSSLTMPAGFVDKQVEYGGEYVGGAGIPDSEDITVLYLSEADGENAGYYIYDKDKDILFPYLTVLSVSANFTLIWPEENIETPAGYEETAFNWKGKDVPAWKAKGPDGPVYLIYARNGAGEMGFYLYNAEDESVQRYTAPPEPEPEPTAEVTAAPTAQPVSAPEKDDSAVILDRIAFMAICAAGVLLLAGLVIFMILYLKTSRGKRKAARMAKGMNKGINVKDADI
jgi:hypothetical protein